MKLDIITLQKWSLAILLLIVALPGLAANAENKPAPPAQSKPSVAKPNGLPLHLSLNTVQAIYHAKQNIGIQADLTAEQPVTLCLYPFHPEANFVVEVSRGGYGKLETPAKAVQLSKQDMADLKRIPLEPGQTYHATFNLKKMVPILPMAWKTGDYRIQAKFFLCGKTEGAETPIPADSPLHIMILE